VEPAHALLAKDVVPSEIASLELRRRGQAAIRHAHRAANAEPALGEVQSVAHGAPDAVIGTPLDEPGIDTALQDEIFDETAHVIVGKGGTYGRPEAEAAAQSARDVVFAAAFPGFELAGRAHAALAGVEPEHDFSEGDQVEFAGTGGLDVQSRH